MSLNSYKEQENVAKSTYYPKVDTSFSHEKYFDTFSLKEYDALNVDTQNVTTLIDSLILYK